jgi:hypothetical protein
LDDPSLGFVSLPNWDDRSSDLRFSGNDINSVAGLIGDALLDLLQSARTDYNWKAMGALSTLIFPDGISSPPSLDFFGRIAAKTEPLDAVSILPETYTSNDDCDEMLELYLSDEIHLCSAQVAETTAKSIADMSFFILNRLEAIPLPDEGDQGVMELGLVVIALISGHRGNMSRKIAGAIPDKDCMLLQCYLNVMTDQ